MKTEKRAPAWWPEPISSQPPGATITSAALTLFAITMAISTFPNYGAVAQPTGQRPFEERPKRVWTTAGEEGTGLVAKAKRCRPKAATPLGVKPVGVMFVLGPLPDQRPSRLLPSTQKT